MKKIVPDPPPSKPTVSPFFTIRADTSPSDALMHISELLRGVAETINEHCRRHAGEPGLGMLANSVQATEIARALSEHVLDTLDMTRLRGEA